MTGGIRDGAPREPHARWYAEHERTFERFRDVLVDLVGSATRDHGLEVQAVTGRVKSYDSFREKADRRHREDPHQPRYTDPPAQIEDLVGVRVIVYLESDVTAVRSIVEGLFETRGPEARADLDDEAVPGYRSTHYVVGLGPARLALPEYAPFRGLRAELQVRTVLQHSWAQIQHDLLYKGQVDVDPRIRRRFIALAGLLELADAEFNALVPLVRSKVEADASPDADDRTRRLDAPALRHLITRRFDGAEVIADVWFQALAQVVEDCEVRSADDLERLLEDARLPSADAVARALAVDGNVPSPVELLDGLLRVALGNGYLHRRANYLAASVQQRSEMQAAFDGFLARVRA